MRRINFEDIDELTLQVVRADMARAHSEPLALLPAPSKQVQVEDDSNELPLFLRRQAE